MFGTLTHPNHTCNFKDHIHGHNKKYDMHPRSLLPITLHIVVTSNGLSLRSSCCVFHHVKVSWRWPDLPSRSTPTPIHSVEMSSKDVSLSQTMVHTVAKIAFYWSAQKTYIAIRGQQWINKEINFLLLLAHISCNFLKRSHDLGVA